MRIGVPSVDALLVTASAAAIAISIGLVTETPESVAFPPSATGTQVTQQQRLPLLVVVGGNSPTDTAVGRAVADAADGALLAVNATGLTDQMSAELSTSRPVQALILGGPDVVSEAVAATLRRHTSGLVTRLAGADRFATAAVVAQSRFTSPAQRVQIMTGAVPAGPARVRAREALDGPVLLVERDRIPATTAAALRELRPRRISVVGGLSAVSDGVLEQLQAFTTGRVVRSP